MALPQDFITELHERNDIVEVVSSYVALKRSGRLFTGLCPFHNEKTPSFTVYPDTQHFYCYGCQQGGDVISFVMKEENLEYIEAVRLLASRASMQLPEESDDKLARQRKRILEANKLAARFYFDCLNSDEGKPARGYLRSRGLSDSTITRFGVGYAPDGYERLSDYLRSRGFYDGELVAAGLCGRGRGDSIYDFFRNRVMFPVIDLRKNVVAFSGRVFGDSADKRKYVNTSDTPVFKKSRVLFGMNIAKNNKNRRIILAEGQMDAIALHQAGFTEAVAAMGTALTDEHVRIISQYADEVVLAYDSDAAGQNAVKKALDKFKNTKLFVRVLSIPNAKDVDEFIRKFGSERFALLLEQSDNSTEYELNRAKRAYDIFSDSGKLQFLKEATEILSRCTSATERDLYAGRVAEELKSVSKSAILVEVESAIKRRSRRDSRTASKQSADVTKRFSLPASARSQLGSEAAGRRLVAVLFKYPDMLPTILKYADESDFKSQQLAEIFAALRGEIEGGRFAGMATLSELFSPESLSLLSGAVAAESGINAAVDDAVFLAKRLGELARAPDREALAGMNAEEIKNLIDKSHKE